MPPEGTGEARGNILVVDDNPANLRLLSDMLAEQGYKVRSVIDGPMALTAARAAPPDLVLLDINMPDMDGYQVCQALRADGRTADTPVIFISAMDEIEDKIRAFDAGGMDYVTKPFQFQEVAARVETHLALQRLKRELQAANVELARQLDELQARNEELDAFSHTVAHDLKNPLASLIGYSTLLESRHAQMEAEQLADFLATITQNGRRMNNIIEELLLLSNVRKVEEIKVEPLDMGAIVAGACERLAGLIEAHEAALVTPDDWPTALGRAQWVEEVWANYISNAIKYGGRPPRVTLGAREADGHVRFWVRDNGAGLTAVERAALFAPFERLHQVRAEGHGLGLSIVRRIVEKLEGAVGVESEPGQGSEFFFTLAAP
jgi:signal transduction histidine kinase